MQIVVQREPSKAKTTMGRLSLDGIGFCDTLEDVIRERPGVPVAEWKVWGETAIPAGVYRIAVVNSMKFGPETLAVKDVPGFEAIRIHAGNTHADTHGCLLVGYRTSDDFVGMSRIALQKLKDIVLKAMREVELVTIEYRNPKEKKP